MLVMQTDPHKSSVAGLAGDLIPRLMDLKGPCGICEKLVPPLITLGLAELVLVTEFRDGPTLKALNHDLSFRLGAPLSSVHG
jgi:hypothetical protein